MEDSYSDKQLAKIILDTVPLIARTLEATMRQAQQHLSPAHFGILKILSESKSGALSQNELAGRLHISPSTLSATVETLVKRDWLKRTTSPEDRRVTLIETTPTGRALLEQLDSQAIASLTKIITPLDESERTQLMTGLTILRQAIINGFANSQDVPPGFPPFPPLDDLPFPFPFPKTGQPD